MWKDEIETYKKDNSTRAKVGFVIFVIIIVAGFIIGPLIT